MGIKIELIHTWLLEVLDEINCIYKLIIFSNDVGNKY